MEYCGKSFEQEEKEFLEKFIFTYKLPDINDNSKENWAGVVSIELVLNPQCNQQCEYCYIHRFGKQLYPLETRGTKEQQIENTKLLINFLVKNKLFVGNWQLFGGDLFHDNIIFDIFDELLNYYTLAREDAEYMFSKYTSISIPNNMSYIYDDNIFEKLIDYKKKFQQNDVCLNFSWSTDGKYCADTREKKQLNDEYWDTMFKRIKQLGAGLHPMIAPENIENWCENYIWWIDMMKKYDLQREGWFQPSILEVRNDGWTEEKIQSYLNLIKFMFVYRMKLNDDDPKKMAAHYFLGDGTDGSLTKACDMDPIKLCYLPLDPDVLDRMPCHIQEALHIDMSTLQIIPCHRLAYMQFRAGKFTVENNEIVGIDPINPSSYIAIHTVSNKCFPICSECKWKDWCMKGCLGSQFETNGDIYIPIESVCNLLKAKYTYLIMLLNQTGVLQSALDNNYIRVEQYKNALIEKSEELGFELEY